MHSSMARLLVRLSASLPFPPFLVSSPSLSLTEKPPAPPLSSYCKVHPTASFLARTHPHCPFFSPESDFA